MNLKPLKIYNKLNSILLLIRNKKLLAALSIISFAVFIVNVILNLYLKNLTSFILRIIAHPMVGFVSILLAIDFLVISKIKISETFKGSSKNNHLILLILTLVMFSVFTTLDIYLYRHSLYTPITIAMCITFYLFISLYSNIRFDIIFIYIPLLIAILLIVQYNMFSPSFGNDTWRDIMWSEETLRTGHFTESRIVQGAYSFPIVVLIYAIISLLIGYTPIIASSTIGFMYLFVIGILISILAKRIYGSTKRFELVISLLLLYSTPVITLWSVWFIPQALALLFMLLLIWSFFYKGSSIGIIQVVLALILVFTHPGLALFTLIYLAYLNLFLPENKKFRKFILFMFILFTSYLIYSAVQYSLIVGLSSYLESIIAILSGGVKPMQVSVVLGFLNRIVPYIPFAIALTFGINSLLTITLKQDKASRWLVLTIFFSITALLVGFLLNLVDPFATADRYIGLPSTILMILCSLPGIRITRIGGKIARVYFYTLIGLMILILAFGGTFTPLNPITTNPSQYSIYGLVNYGDKIEIQSISNMLNPQNPLTVYTDWRTYAFLLNNLLTRYDSNFNIGLSSVSFGNMKIWIFGANGYHYSESQSYLFNGSILIFRETSITMLESWGGLRPNFDYSNSNVIYSSGNIRLYAG